MTSREEAIDEAAAALRRARAVIVAAGAGMGVDSGLPDFRGREGFWRAYPAYAKLGLPFEAMASPRWFRDDPALAWGFYGHRLGLYRRTQPHDGFAALLRLRERLPEGLFVFTSNVDGQFQRAGFPEDEIVECHGAIDYLQCARNCGAGLFAAAGVEVDVDLESFRARPPFPTCPRCGEVARPNVLMFGDAAFDPARVDAQERALAAWIRGKDARSLVVIECGAGTGVPTVRHFAEGLVRAYGVRLVRINVREPEVPGGQIGIAAGARDTLLAIDERLRSDATS